MLINEIKTKRGYRYILVNEDNGEILSSLYVLFKHRNNLSAEICRVAVKEKNRGQGYAKSLLEFVVDLYSDIDLCLHACPYGNHINKNNIEYYRKKLKRLYSKFGFISKVGTKSVMIKSTNMGKEETQEWQSF